MLGLSYPAVAMIAAFLMTFAGTAVAGYWLAAREASDRSKARNRLRGLTPATAPSGWRIEMPKWTRAAMPKLGSLAAVIQQRQVTGVSILLLRAGYFQANAPQIFLATRFLLALVLAPAGGLLALRDVPPSGIKLAGFILTGFATGLFLPGWWLSAQVQKRHQLLRNALPDALDMLVLCLEGGTSVNAAIQRVTDELHGVHPVLGMEMNILQRQVQLGLTAGEALRKFADRCGLEDVRELALVVLQSERYGAGVSKALRDYAESARADRQVKAQERAQKAAVKILMPTLLCIFPAIFIVLLGPAAFQMARLFSR